jgi:hypothetical protein
MCALTLKSTFFLTNLLTKIIGDPATSGIDWQLLQNKIRFWVNAANLRLHAQPLEKKQPLGVWEKVR